MRPLNVNHCGCALTAFALLQNQNLILMLIAAKIGCSASVSNNEHFQLAFGSTLFHIHTQNVSRRLTFHLTQNMSQKMKRKTGLELLLLACPRVCCSFGTRCSFMPAPPPPPPPPTFCARLFPSPASLPASTPFYVLPLLPAPHGRLGQALASRCILRQAPCPPASHRRALSAEENETRLSRAACGDAAC